MDDFTIKIKVDDSAEKKYSQERAARLKLEIEQEKSKAIMLKGIYAKEAGERNKEFAGYKVELNKKQASLDAALRKEIIAYQGGKEMKIKEAIAFRKVAESEMRLLEQTNRLVNSKELADYRAMLKQKEMLLRNQLSQQRNISGPRTNLAGDIGSLSYLNQIKAAQSKMTFGTPDYIKTGVLIDQYTAKLTKAGVDVRSFSQKVGGEMTTALNTSKQAMFSTITNAISPYIVSMGAVIAAQKLWQLSLDQKKFEVLQANFKGTTDELLALQKASAFTVSEASLMKLSMQASDLGINMKQQAILFALAEDAADKYGGSVEDNFLALVNSSEGAIKGLKSIGVQKEVYEKIVKDLAKIEGDAIDNLDPEIQKRIRLEALIKASGVTYEQAVNKMQDAADMQEELSVGLGDLITKYGWAVVKGIMPFLGGLEKIGASVVYVKHHYKEWIDFLENHGIGALVNFTKKMKEIDNSTLGHIFLEVTHLGNAIKDSEKSTENLGAAIRDLNTIDLSGIRSQIYSLSKGFSGNLEDAVRSLSLRFGISWEEALKMIKDSDVSFGTEEKAGQGNVFKDTKGSKTKKEAEKTWLEQLLERYKKINDEIVYFTTLSKDVTQEEFVRLNAVQELIKKYKELNEIKFKGQREKFGDFVYPDEQNTGNEPFSFSGDKIKSIAIRKRTKEEYEMMLAFEKEKWEMEIQTAQNMIGYFQEMLGYVMEMPKEMSFILNALSQFLAGMGGGGSGIFGMLGGLLSLIPGGGLIGGIAGMIGAGTGGGGGSGGGNMPFRPIPVGGGGGNNTFVIQGDLKEYAEMRIYEKGREQAKVF